MSLLVAVRHIANKSRHVRASPTVTPMARGGQPDTSKPSPHPHTTVGAMPRPRATGCRPSAIVSPPYVSKTRYESVSLPMRTAPARASMA
eukprot:scaffold5717_cov112-Isochrysis_galbana.AAC.17